MKLKIQFGWAALLALTMVVGTPSAKAQVNADGNHVQIGQAKDDLFAGTHEFAKNASGVTQIHMGPHSLDEVEGSNADKARRTVLSVVRTYSYDKPGMYNVADVQKFRDKLATGGWNCSVHTYDQKGNSTDVCERQRTDGLRESAIITVSPKSLTFIHTIKRPSAHGDSRLEMPGVPGLSSLDDLTALAMLDSDMLPLQLSLQHMQLPDMDAMQAKLDDAMKSMPTLDSAEMERKMAAAQKALDKATKEMNNLKAPESRSNPDAGRPQE